MMQQQWTAVRSDRIAPQQVLRWLLALACGCVLLGTGNLQAQTLYRIVGPDGRVTFSDKPPDTPASKVTPVNSTLAAAQSGVPLPYELRQVVGKYPVTLYTGNNCAPCDSGRSLLVARGVPFSEKTITTAQDADALQKLSGNNSLPFLTIGTQHVAGFSASEWAQYLTAAGYPQSSKLPAGYRAPPAMPLVAVEKPVAPAVSTTAPAEPVLPPITEPRPNPANPAGIQF
ncbi:glutaredoxin family protein [Rhodoferax sp.]|uniref:glutaredoxin family protein n=1 Tax=Rhodoferax sp. TaxID=50421 RepID=UPI0025D0DD7A|nr:glutaredoxin family protein [Rhodoferax sp.]